MIDQIIRKRLLKKNKNFIGVFTGEPGSGKTWGCLSIGEMVDPDFSIDKVTTPRDDDRGLIQLLNSGTLKRGSVVVMEEAGVDLSSRDWQSFGNKAINTVLQTFRWEGIALLMNVPVGAFVDKWARSLWNGYGEMLYVDDATEISVMKYFNVSYSDRYKTIYYKYPHKYKNGRWVQQKSIAIPKPSEELLAEYEPLQKKFKSEIKQDLGVELKKRKQDTKEKEANKKIPVNVNECAKNVLGDIDKFKNRYRNREFLDIDLIKANINCSGREAKTIKKIGEKALGWI